MQCCAQCKPPLALTALDGFTNLWVEIHDLLDPRLRHTEERGNLRLRRADNGELLQLLTADRGKTIGLVAGNFGGDNRALTGHASLHKC